MGGVGAALVITGIWFAYAGYKNVSPLRTLVQIVQKPQDARQILADKTNKIDDPAAMDKVDLAQTTTPITGTYQTGQGNAVVAFARSQIGKPYQFGGIGNPGWDCSGLTQAALGKINVIVPHSALGQLNSSLGTKVPGNIKDLSKALPGDLIFPNVPAPGNIGDHVGIYAGNGMIIHAPKPGSNVSEIPVWSVAAIRRFTGVGQNGGF